MGGALKNIGKAAALSLAFSAAALSTVSAQNAPPEAPPQNRLYASAETRQKLGWIADRMTEWAGTNVILIEADDLRLSDQQKQYLSSLDTSDDLFNTDQEAYYQNLGEKNAILIPAVNRHFESMGIGRDAVPELFANDSAAGMAEHAAYKRAYALSYSSAARPGQKDFCLVTLPDTKIDAKAHAAFYGQTAADKLENIPGTGAEWLALGMAHEAGHCANPGKGELAADRHAISIYFSERAAGRVRNAAVPGAFIDMRALAMYTRPFTEYATSPNLETGRPRTHSEPVDGNSAIARVKEKVTARLSGPQTPAAWLETLKALDREGAFRDDPAAQKYADRMLRIAGTYARPLFSPPRAPGI